MPRALTAAEIDRILRELARIQQEMEAHADAMENAFDAAMVSAQARSLAAVQRILTNAPDLNALNVKDRLRWWIDHQQALEEALVHNGYTGAVHAYAAALPEFVTWVEQLASAQGQAFERFPPKLLNYLKDRSTDQFLHAGATGNAALSDMLYAEVFSGKPNAKVVDALREALPEVYRKYAGTYSRTNHFKFSRELAMQQADEAGADTFLYVGPVDEANRPFCRELMTQPVRTRAEIAAMDNHMPPEQSDVFTCGGGYNCRHHWTAISARLADKIKARLEAGNVGS